MLPPIFKQFRHSINFHEGIGNRQVLFKFPNSYGASVVQGPYTYGGPQGLFEMAVIRWDDDEYDIDYTTPVSDDVLGHLTSDEVIETLTLILNLPEASLCTMESNNQLTCDAQEPLSKNLLP